MVTLTRMPSASFGGIRIEENVLVGAEGFDVLTQNVPLLADLR